MLSHILLAGEKDPTISVGGILKAIGGNIRVGSSDVFVTEACEYTNSFLHFFPKISVILNIDADHLDFFKDLQDIRSSFRRFAQLLPKDGVLIINKEIEHLEEITDGLACRVITFGLDPSADYSAAGVSHDDKGDASFDLIRRGENCGRIRLSVKGDHNICNAPCPSSLWRICSASPWRIRRKGLASFTGTDRRFELKGDWNGVTVIDDYAHHPTEIRATLRAAKAYPHREVWCVFPAPHLHPHKGSLRRLRRGADPGGSRGAGGYLCRPRDGHPGHLLLPSC